MSGRAERGEAGNLLEISLRYHTMEVVCVMEPVLIVEDEPAIADLIEMTLSPHGYPCRKARSAEEAADLLDENRFSLVLLDVMLPGADGFALMDYIGSADTPVVFVTARTDVADRVRGLRAGAYDYISKPFAPDELLARVDGLMRHTGRLGPGLSVWGVEIDGARRVVSKDGEEIRLTPREFDLLMLLVRNRGITLYRDVLLDQVWGDECPESTRTLDIHISRLRRKLGWKRCLVSVPGVGYRLEGAP